MTAEQARAKSYEDGHKKSCSDYSLFVASFDSKKNIEHYVSNLVNCNMIAEGKEGPAQGPSTRKKPAERDRGAER